MSAAPDTPPVEPPAGRPSRYWRQARRVTGGLLLLWLLVTLIAPWFARDLSAYRVFGFPLSFWLASQGTLLLYLLIVVAYAVLAERLEDRAASDGAAGAEGVSRNG